MEGDLLILLGFLGSQLPTEKAKEGYVWWLLASSKGMSIISLRDTEHWHCSSNTDLRTYGHPWNSNGLKKQKRTVFSGGLVSQRSLAPVSSQVHGKANYSVGLKKQKSERLVNFTLSVFTTNLFHCIWAQSWCHELSHNTHSQWQALSRSKDLIWACSLIYFCRPWWFR